MAAAPTAEEVRTRVTKVFNAVAGNFDGALLPFWNHFGRRTVEFADIQVGSTVLDACCGSGAAALASAERAGSSGAVVGVDVAERMLDLARAKAGHNQLTNINFLHDDITRLDLPDGSFDAVVCVFGIFFLPDMVVGLSELWRMVRPGGVIVITTWGRQVLEPVNRIFWDAVDGEGAHQAMTTPPWSRIAREPGLRKLFARAGLPGPTVVHETYTQPIDIDSIWAAVLGTGYRGVIDAMPTEAAARVRTAIERRLSVENVQTATAEVMYARSTKPG